MEAAGIKQKNPRAAAALQPQGAMEENPQGSASHTLQGLGQVLTGDVVDPLKEKKFIVHSQVVIFLVSNSKAEFPKKRVIVRSNNA